MKKSNTNKRKRIVFVDQNLNGGGAERILCTVLRSLNPSEFDMHLVLIGSKGTLTHLIPHCVKVHELGISNTRKALFSFIKKIKEIRPDSVFSTLSRTTVLSIISRPFCPEYRLVARYPNMPSLQLKWGTINGWRYWLMKKTYNKVDIIIAQTEEMAEDLHHCYKIPKKKISTIHNPVDTNYINECLEGSKDPFLSKHINIVASGRLTLQKGYETLILAFSKIKKKNNNFRLHILGQDNNNYRSTLDALIKKYDLENKIIFHGFVKNPYPFYKFCDLFVLSSRWEGFPNVLLENLYLEKKVVVTRCVPIIEKLVTNGKNGFVVDVDDANAMASAISNFHNLTPTINKNIQQPINKIIDCLR
jgi:glycosyltransferase involved in cell wall biosynthesis